MIPISDDNSDRKTRPYVNYIFIAINILVFIYFQNFGTNLNFTYSYSTVPAEILTGHDIVTDPVIVQDPVSGQQVQIPGLGVTAIPVWLTLITSMFMHGGFAHLGGNMLYLWIFGDNLEDRLGHARYFLFYMVCGILASLTHVFTDYLFGENHLIPSLGASGAISGVMGGYLLLFPTKRGYCFYHIFIYPGTGIYCVGVMDLIAGCQWNGLPGWQRSQWNSVCRSYRGFIAGLLLIKRFHPANVKYSRR